MCILVIRNRISAYCCISYTVFIFPFDCICVSGSVVGNRICNHPDIRKVGFTGSTPVGKAIMERYTVSRHMFHLFIHANMKEKNIRIQMFGFLDERVPRRRT